MLSVMKKNSRVGSAIPTKHGSSHWVHFTPTHSNLAVTGQETRQRKQNKEAQKRETTSSRQIKDSPVSWPVCHYSRGPSLHKAV